MYICWFSLSPRLRGSRNAHEASSNCCKKSRHFSFIFAPADVRRLSTFVKPARTEYSTTSRWVSRRGRCRTATGISTYGSWELFAGRRFRRRTLHGALLDSANRCRVVVAPQRKEHFRFTGGTAVGSQHPGRWPQTRSTGAHHNLPTPTTDLLNNRRLLPQLIWRKCRARNSPCDCSVLALAASAVAPLLPLQRQPVCGVVARAVLHRRRRLAHWAF